jgi:hypothetical protein
MKNARQTFWHTAISRFPVVVGYRTTMCIAFPMQTFLMPSVTIHFPEA